MNLQILEKAQELVSLLSKKQLKIAVAESCTGGMVTSYITAVSGASQVFELGITSYSNDIKNKFLKVNTATLRKFGAVSQETANEMAKNIRALSGADIGISVTGVAGPDSQEGHTPGTVFIAYCNGHDAKVKKLNIQPESRNFVREQTVFQLLSLVINNTK